MHSTGMPEFGATILIGVSSYGTLGHVRPSTSNSLIFSVHFRTASLTVAFVRLPLQICLYSASAATVVQSQIPELFHCIVSCHYETNNFRVVLSPPRHAHQIMATPYCARQSGCRIDQFIENCNVTCISRRHCNHLLRCQTYHDNVLM